MEDSGRDEKGRGKKESRRGKIRKISRRKEGERENVESGREDNRRGRKEREDKQETGRDAE